MIVSLGREFAGSDESASSLYRHIHRLSQPNEDEYVEDCRVQTYKIIEGIDSARGGAK